MKGRSSATASKAVVEIISQSVMPTILQSDNGTEFLGEQVLVCVYCRCIKAIHHYFPTIRVIRGRPCHPQSQGFIERGNKPFKGALQDWMQENGTADWSIGCYIVQHQMNRRASESHQNTVPYETYYGLSTVS
mmetsp:Transcript_7922/g.11498  ORF Transcript_7922/g.11498 Transcript_7922/m.11498 type:complete len:133 (+) Transcript_7922:622-1020(+)